MKQILALGLVATISMAIAQSAEAGLIETSSTRYVLTDANGGTTHDGPLQINGPSPYGPFTGISETVAIEDANGGTNQSYQVSDVAPGLYTAEISTNASAFGDGSDFSDSYSQGYYEVKFTLTTPETFSISGVAGAFGFINGETSITTIKINNLGGVGTPTMLILEQMNEYIPFSQSGTLLPGNYSLTVDSLSIVDRTFVDGFGDANAGVVGLVMTVTPEPATAFLVAIAGLALVRRRR